jgi:molybdopterin-containing oxidoreductase family iron-sulfur binding subunit
MSSNKKYWKSVEELENGSIVEALRNNEFVEAFLLKSFGSKETMSSSTSRRDF